ncbi:hypothetical protein NDU88_001010 [Pleurodeles waltl]|uniref:Uncharacterized protein n=1 Tax=Pleurodeles waltl TaxID=8319 RepID=A0AAV7LZ80_PLEWA|nr:hypothetical protein NDU88_001010 [Pleurodeles waltl]
MHITRPGFSGEARGRYQEPLPCVESGHRQFGGGRGVRTNSKRPCTCEGRCGQGLRGGTRGPGIVRVDRDEHCKSIEVIPEMPEVQAFQQIEREGTI